MDAGDTIDHYHEAAAVEVGLVVGALPRGEEEKAGSLLVTVVQADELVNKDTFTQSDPYCIVTCGAEHFRTATVNDNNSPEWGESFKFWPSRPDKDTLQVDIFDCDAGDGTGHDNSLGSVTVTVKDVIAAGVMEKAFLVGKKTGTLTLSLTWQAATPTPALTPKKDLQLTGLSAPSGAYVPLFAREESIEVVELKRESRSRLALAESLRHEIAAERERHMREIAELRRDVLAAQSIGALPDPDAADPAAMAALHCLRLELLEERRLHVKEQAKHRKVLLDFCVFCLWVFSLSVYIYS